MGGTGGEQPRRRRAGALTEGMEEARGEDTHTAGQQAASAAAAPSLLTVGRW